MDTIQEELVNKLKKNVHPSLKDSPLEKAVDNIIDLMPRLDTEVHDINRGGCGIFAYLLWKKLLELGYKDIKVVPLLFTEPSVFNINKEKLMAISQNFQEVADDLDPNFEYDLEHIQLELLDKDRNIAIGLSSNSVDIIPTTEIEGYRIDTFHAIGSPIPFDILEKIIEKGIWNSDYDRAQTPLLEDILATLA